MSRAISGTPRCSSAFLVATPNGRRLLMAWRAWRVICAVASVERCDCASLPRSRSASMRASRVRRASRPCWRRFTTSDPVSRTTRRTVTRRAAKSRTIDGLVLVDKPAGVTSHDVVAVARRVLGTRRIGHTGTLDPFATGLLVLLVGHATRLMPYVHADPKVYDAVMAFGTE